MRSVNPTIVQLTHKPDPCGGPVNVGDYGFTTHLPDPGDAADNCVGVKFPHCHLWLAFHHLAFLTPHQREAPPK